MPMYLGICFFFHFWIGVTALVGALVLVGITALTETRTRGPAKASSRLAVSRSALAVEGRRNAEVLQAKGMRQQAAERWQDINSKYLAACGRAALCCGPEFGEVDYRPTFHSTCEVARLSGSSVRADRENRRWRGRW
jgi:ABC-type protease/lipase transport system fused ATPase/permease subunit